MAFDAPSTEEMRIALSAAGPIPNAVLYNNAKDLAAAMEAGGVVFGGGGGGGGVVPVGTILHTGQSVIPAGFLDCDGSSQLRSVYPDLFDAIGTTYGPGAVPGTTFALPTVTGTYGNFVICADAAAVVVETRSLIGAPIGTLLLYADSTYPTGWLRADGTAISRTTYADLFAIIGTTYGAGDGSTTFNLPNLLSSGTPSPVYIIKAILSGTVEPSTVAHASSHIRAGTDVIDGDRVQVDYVPTWYVRNAAASGAGAVTDLTAHLDGVNTLAGQGHIVCTSLTRPSGPSAGTMIYETDTKFIVVFDGTNWIEMMSPRSPPGFSFLREVNVGTTTSILMNEIFSSKYRSYKLVYSLVSNQATIGNVQMKFRTAGVDLSSGYYNRLWYSNGVTSTTANQNNVASCEWAIYHGNIVSAGIVEFINPATTNATVITWRGGAFGGSTNIVNHGIAYNGSTSVLDGLALRTITGSFTGGNIKIYGLKDGEFS